MEVRKGIKPFRVTGCNRVRSSELRTLTASQGIEPCIQPVLETSELTQSGGYGADGESRTHYLSRTRGVLYLMSFASVVDRRRLELRLQVCRTRVLPLTLTAHYSNLVRQVGFEPTTHLPCHGRALPD